MDRSEEHKLCECEICKKKINFDLPEELLEDLIKGNVILFAGAGTSTESRGVFKETLYSEIKNELFPKKDVDINFSKLMTKFCQRTNGRKKLLEKIKKRFDYCNQFSEIYRSASDFHRTIAPIWMLQNIITTNWDDFFEKETDAIPMVSSEDLAFYNIDQRKVFKIHGSTSNYGSIVATEEDYEKCYENLRTGTIGAFLKSFIATKTIIFVGYSFRDEDLNRILELLKEEMQDLIPHIYIVTLDDSVNERIQNLNATVIKTDGSFFFSKIKDLLIEQEIMLDEDSILQVSYMQDLINTVHQWTTEIFMKNRTPSSIYCMLYQDGMIHATDYIKHKQKSGIIYNPHFLIKQIHTYEEHIKKDYLKAKNYQEVAYLEGYIEGLTIPFKTEDELKSLETFYIFGKGGISDSKKFEKIIKQKEIYHKTAEKEGQKHFKRIINASDEIVPHHTPFL